MKKEGLFHRSSLHSFTIILTILFSIMAFGQFVMPEVQAQTGTLHVVITPPEALDDGAQWRVDGGAWRDSGGYVPLEPGEYTVEFKPTTGWHTPANETATITENQTTEIAGNYKRLRDLKVTLTPQEAVNDGVQWNVDGGDWEDSGTTVTGLSVGEHTVNYKTVEGWIAPGSETVTVNDGETTEITRAYTPDRALRVTIIPQGAIDAGAQWNADGGAWQSSGRYLKTINSGQFLFIIWNPETVISSVGSEFFCKILNFKVRINTKAFVNLWLKKLT